MEILKKNCGVMEILKKSTDSTRCELERGGAHNACGSPRRGPLRARVVGAQLAGAIQPTTNHRCTNLCAITKILMKKCGVKEILMKKMWRKGNPNEKNVA